MIEGVTDKDIQVLIKLYEEAEIEIISKIEKADFLNRASKEKTLQQIQNILTQLYNPTAEFVTSKSKSEYQSGVQEVQQALGSVDLKGTFNLVDPKVTQFVMETLKDMQEGALTDVKNVLSNSYQSIQSTLSLVSKSVKNEYASKIANELGSKIAVGQILGTPRKEISKRLAQVITEKGITGFNYVTESGKQRNLSLSAYVQGLTRQVLINSRASAVVSTALAMGQDLLQISTHSNPSPMCAKWQGDIISISGKTDGYSTLSDALFNGDYSRGGIFHRFCRHSFTVYIPTSIQFKS